jgi:hypothetical protein
MRGDVLGRELQLTRGQVVWIDGRQTTFLDSYSPSACIVRFHGEQQTRVVPVRKLQTDRSDRPANTAPGRDPASRRTN